MTSARCTSFPPIGEDTRIDAWRPVHPPRSPPGVEQNMSVKMLSCLVRKLVSYLVRKLVSYLVRKLVKFLVNNARKETCSYRTAGYCTTTIVAS